MKKLFTSILLLITGLTTFAQTPTSFNYQAVLRDASGGILANQQVEIGVAILQGSASGTEVFSETHSVTTNNFGLANLQIGSVNTTGMENIDWSSGSYFIQISVDGTIMGTSQLLSVPFALHAKTVENDKVEDADADPGNELQILSISNDTIYLSNGGKVKLPPETDPAFTYWDKSSGVAISESQITDLDHFTGDDISGNETAFDGWDKDASDDFTTADETDPIFSSSLAAAITAADTARWASNNYTQNELQNLKLENQQLSISGGNTIDLSEAYYIADSSATNELQDITLNGTQLSITKGSTVDLSEVQDGDKQRLSLGVTNQHEIRLNISNANFVEMPFVKDGVSKYNWSEAENYVARWGQYGAMQKSTIYDNGNIGIGTEKPSAKLEVAGQVKITGGEPGADKILVSDPNGLATWKTNPDNDATNELQVLSISNDTIFLSNGGFVKLPAAPLVSLNAAYKNGNTITANAGAVNISGTDGFIATGTEGTGNDLSVSGEGTRLIWYPKKGAFRAGTIDLNFAPGGTNDSFWDTDSIGKFSVATGLNSKATGLVSTATGFASTASGFYSFAAGYATTASGYNSTAMGAENKATGAYSTAMGANTTAQSFRSLAIGSYNIGGGSTNNWVKTDPLFEIGNGTSASNHSNAFTVYKNGTVEVAGQIKNLTPPSDSLDAVNKAYVDSLIDMNTIILGSTARLLAAGFSVEKLYAYGHTVTELLDAGVTITELVAAGIDVSDLIAAGITYNQLVAAGANISVLIATGITYAELVAAGADISALLDAGVSVSELLTAGASIENLLNAGISVSDLLSAGASINGLLNAGASISDLLFAEVTVDQLLAEGVTIVQLLDANINIALLLNANVSVAALLEAGTTITDLIDAGINYSELIAAGASISDFTTAGITLSDLIDAGINYSELIVAGVTVTDFANIGITLSDLIDAGVSYSELITAGATIDNLINAGISLDDLINAGISLEKIVKAGAPIVDLINTYGYSINELYNAGASVPDLIHATGATAPELYNAGVSIQDLLDAKAGLISEIIEKTDASEQDFMGKVYEGGIIYYTNYADRYFLACAINATVTKTWCASSVNSDNLFVNGTSEDFLKGDFNTTTILNKFGVNAPAAHYCRNLNINGYSDWHLPSLNELKALMDNYTLVNNVAKDLGGTCILGATWSSTQFTISFFGDTGQTNSYSCNYKNGNTVVSTDSNKKTELYVIPVKYIGL